MRRKGGRETLRVGGMRGWNRWLEKKLSTSHKGPRLRTRYTKCGDLGESLLFSFSVTI